MGTIMEPLKVSICAYMLNFERIQRWQLLEFRSFASVPNNYLPSQSPIPSKILMYPPLIQTKSTGITKRYMSGQIRAKFSRN